MFYCPQALHGIQDKDRRDGARMATSRWRHRKPLLPRNQDPLGWAETWEDLGGPTVLSPACAPNTGPVLLACLRHPRSAPLPRTWDETGPQPLSEDKRRFGGQVSQGGAGHTAWSSPFTLDSSPLLPGLGETQTTLPLPIPSTPPPPQEQDWGGGRCGGGGEAEAPLTSSPPPHLWPTSSPGPGATCKGPQVATTQPRSPLTQAGEKKSLAGIQKPIWSGADLTGVPLGYLK